MKYVVYNKEIYRVKEEREYTLILANEVCVKKDQVKEVIRVKGINKFMALEKIKELHLELENIVKEMI